MHADFTQHSKRWSICTAPRRENFTSKALRCGSHSLTCQHTTPAFTRSSPGGATTEWTVTAPADEAYYSLIDPVRMKGWVGLVGWPTADVWPTKWSSVQLAVRRRTGKVRRSKTSVLPLCYAEIHLKTLSLFNKKGRYKTSAHHHWPTSFCPVLYLGDGTAILAICRISSHVVEQVLNMFYVKMWTTEYL